MNAMMRGRMSTVAVSVALGCAALLWAPLAWAGPAQAKAGAGLMQLVAALLLLAVVGLGIGSFGLTVNHTFRQRAALSYRVMLGRPKLSLAAGAVVTLLALGLLAVLRPLPPLQLVVMIAYVCALMPFALGAAARLASVWVEPPLGGRDDELPGARAHLRGGLVLSGVNAVPILGSVLFFGLLLAAVGASLLAYFARFRGAPAAADSAEEGQPA